MPKYKLVVADIKQEEFRIAAHLSQDPAMLAIINEGRDWHSETAMAFTGKPAHLLTSEERFFAKTGNFSKLNNASVKRLAIAAKVPIKDARKMSDTFDELYHVYDAWRGIVATELAITGYVTTEFGRRRHLPNIWAPQLHDREEAIRMAVNTRVQGTAADVGKIVLVKMGAALRGIDARLVLYVHDEVVVETIDKHVPYVIQCTRTMTEGVLPGVALPVDVEVGDNWAAYHETENPYGLVAAH